MATIDEFREWCKRNGKVDVDEDDAVVCEYKGTQMTWEDGELDMGAVIGDGMLGTSIVELEASSRSVEIDSTSLDISGAEVEISPW